MKFALFIPCYNVEPTVTEVLERIPVRVLQTASEIICVDNQSQDRTVERIFHFAHNHPLRAKFRVLRNQGNYLLGGSTLVAIRRARELGCDFLINLHSDGQADPLDLLKMIEQCNADEANLVLGSRFLPESQTEKYSLTRKLGNWFFVYLQQFLLRRKVYDLGALMALPLNRLQGFNYERIPHDMAFQPLLLMELLQRCPEIKVDEVAIKWGSAEYSNVNPWSYGVTHLLRCLKFFFGFSFVARANAPRLDTHLVQDNSEEASA